MGDETNQSVNSIGSILKKHIDTDRDCILKWSRQCSEIPLLALFLVTIVNPHIWNDCSSHGNQLYSIWLNNRFQNRLKLTYATYALVHEPKSACYSLNGMVWHSYRPIDFHLCTHSIFSAKPVFVSIAFFLFASVHTKIQTHTHISD